MEGSAEIISNDTDEFSENERLKGRNSEIWKLTLAGWTQERIGDKFQITQARVSQILKKIRESIPEATRETLVTTEIERLDHALAKCWEVMERQHVVVTPSGRVAHEIVEYARDEDDNIRIDDHGNPIPKKLRKVLDDGPTLQAADRIMSISRERRKLLGLDAATRTELSGPGGNPIALQVAQFSDLPEEARLERINLLREEVERRSRAVADDDGDGDEP